MDPVLYAVAMVSFLLGSFGYVTVRFLVIPIGRYRRLKTRIARTLAEFIAHASAQPDSRSKDPAVPGFSKKIRKLSAELSDCYTDQLPHWFKLYLEGRREEFPLEAAKTLMAFAGTKNRDHRIRQVENIRKQLNLSL